MSRNFMELFRARQAEGKSVCVGLDSDYSKIPQWIRTKHSDNYLGAVLDFNRSIIDATEKVACAYKINTAFYEGYGKEGWQALRSTIVHICTIISENVPVILDAKRADIGNTNEGYAQMAFDYLQADAITVNPYFGAEAMQPFLNRADKGIFVLCRTSNSGASEFQDLEVRHRDHLSHIHPEDNQWEPFYCFVARHIANEWNKHGNCGLVVGATYPEQLQRVREIVSDMPILIPGIGAQGGDLEKTVIAGQDSRGAGMIVNSSRGIIFASSGLDFAQAAYHEVQKLHHLINQYRRKDKNHDCI